MIEVVTAWVRDLATTALVLAFAEMLLPRNDLRRFARVVIGLVLVAVILGSLVDLSSIEDNLAAPVVPSAWGSAGMTSSDYVAEGQKVAEAGLAVAGRDVRARLERQVESLARLASRADQVDVRAEVDGSGGLSAIRVTLKFGSGAATRTSDESAVAGTGAPTAPGFREAPGDEVDAALVAEVERSIRDFYGLDQGVPIVVEVSRQTM